MIEIYTPFSRRENLHLLEAMLNAGGVKWTVLLDSDIAGFPKWVRVLRLPKNQDGELAPNSLCNRFYESYLEDETQYMLLADDDSVEYGFFDKIPDADVVAVSMLRGHNAVGKYGTSALIAHPSAMLKGYMGHEQIIVKGKVLRNYRVGPGPCGDGDLIEAIARDHKATFVPDAFVLFNYFEPGRWNTIDSQSHRQTIAGRLQSR